MRGVFQSTKISGNLGIWTNRSNISCGAFQKIGKLLIFEMQTKSYVILREEMFENLGIHLADVLLFGTIRKHFPVRYRQNMMFQFFCSMENGHGSHRVRSMLGNFIHGSFFFSLYGNKWLAELTTKIELNYIVLEIIIVNIFSVLSAG